MSSKNTRWCSICAYLIWNEIHNLFIFRETIDRFWPRATLKFHGDAKNLLTNDEQPLEMKNIKYLYGDVISSLYSFPSGYFVLFNWWWSYLDNFDHFGHSRLQSLTNMWVKALLQWPNYICDFLENHLKMLISLQSIFDLADASEGPDAKGSQ